MNLKTFPGVLVFATLILTFSCTSHPKNDQVAEFKTFPKEYQLTSQTEEWLDIWLCGDLRIYDSILVAISWQSEKFIQVYDLKSKSRIGAFGTEGKGPNEFFGNVQLTPVFFHEGTDLIIQIHESGRKILRNINLTQSMATGKVVTQDTFTIPEEFDVRTPFRTSDSKVFGVKKSVLRMIDPVTHDTIRFNDPIQFVQKLPPVKNFEYIASLMYLELSPRQDRIVGYFHLMKRLHVYNTRGDLLKVIKEPGNHVFDTSDGQIYTRNKVCFSNSFLSDKYILVLNQDRLLATEAPGKLLLFDYQGKAIARYKLDCWIRLGAMDWKAKRFYSFSYKEKAMISFALEGIEE